MAGEAPTVESLSVAIHEAQAELSTTLARYEEEDHQPAGPDGAPCTACASFARIEALAADLAALRAARLELLNQKSHELARAWVGPAPTDPEPTVPPAPASSFDRGTP